MAAVSEDPKQKRVAIIGGGLVGSLNAIYFAKRGFKVDLYESREDPRTQEFVQGRSINLALSVRGIESLKAVNADGPMVEGGIPMYARMIHPRNGEKYAIPYGKKDQCILSVERRKMNEHLLTVAESYANVHHHFEHKLLQTDLDNGQVTCSWDNKELEVKADLIVGCDGAYSTIRKAMMKKPRFDYSQTYIPHGYKELRLKPTEDDQFAIEINYLHIWPRNTFMLIALPNQDHSFTCTLFFPFEQFDMLTNRKEVLHFFSREFPDFKDLMGEDYLVEEFFKNPTGPMVSVKCKPYHVKDKAVIMGDAAHAMVPFYGQGMNCGFEDCLVLDGLMEKHNNNIGAALADYSRTRNPDAEAICDLAMYNYIEMRSSVNSTLFLAKKKLYSFLHRLMPNTIIPLYTMVLTVYPKAGSYPVASYFALFILTLAVIDEKDLQKPLRAFIIAAADNLQYKQRRRRRMVTFSRIPYHIVIERTKFQDKVISTTILCLLLAVGVGGLAKLWTLFS